MKEFFTFVLYLLLKVTIAQDFYKVTALHYGEKLLFLTMAESDAVSLIFKLSLLIF